MNKKVTLVLFPLLSALVLAGCTVKKSTKKKTTNDSDSSDTGGTSGGTSDGGSTSGGTTGGSTTGDTSTFATTAGSAVDASSFTLDFTAEKDSAFPYVEAGGKYTFEYSKVCAGFMLSDAGVFTNSYSGNYWLHFQNYKNNASWGQLAFISNNTPFTKAITKVEVKTVASGGSASMACSVVIGNQYYTTGQTGGATAVGMGKTITATASKSDGYHFFCITSTDQKRNLQVTSISVTLE